MDDAHVPSSQTKGEKGPGCTKNGFGFVPVLFLYSSRTESLFVFFSGKLAIVLYFTASGTKRKTST